MESEIGLALPSRAPAKLLRLLPSARYGVARRPRADGLPLNLPHCAEQRGHAFSSARRSALLRCFLARGCVCTVGHQLKSRVEIEQKFFDGAPAKAGKSIRTEAGALPVGVADDEALPIELGVGVLDGPGRRGSGGQSFNVALTLPARPAPQRSIALVPRARWKPGTAREPLSGWCRSRIFGLAGN